MESRRLTFKTERMASLPKDRLSRVTLLAFAAVIVTLVISLVWIDREARRNDVALSRDVRTVQSGRTIGQLKACLGRELRMDPARRQRGGWNGSASDPLGLRAFNEMTDIGVRLHELGDLRKVVFSTREARPLRPAELDAINRCVGDAA